MTVHASRLKRTLPFLAVLLVVWLVGPASAIGAAAPAQPTRKVTVDQTTQLVNQVVRVTWSGFKPSSDSMLTSSTKYVVRVYQCRGKNPTAVTDCYSATGFTYPGKTKDGLPTPDGPTNAVTTITRPKGTGTADIEVRTTRESTNLGCDSSHPCSLVVIPNDGDPARPDLDFQLANQDNMDQPWAWARRVVVPLNFAPTSLACGLKNPDAASSGSPGILRLIQQWQPKLCRLSKPVDVDYTQVGEPTARTSFGLKTTDLALTTRPDDTTPTRPYTYAPISVSGIAIAYRLDDRDTGQPITDLKLTPRLVAKLITESYAMSAFCRTPKDTTCNGATRDNPVDIFQDPEFLKLNGTAHSWPNSSWPTLVSGENDLTYELTRWLAADGDTQRFLAGKKGKKGDVHVNTHFKGIKYPVSSFESRDNDPSFVHGYIPILGLSEVAHLLVTNRSNSEDYKKDATGNYPKSPPSTVGTRGLIAIVSNADAAALRFPTARLRNAAGKYVAATDAGITAALGQLKTNKDKITQSMDYGGKAAKAYPLTTVQYAQVPTNGVGSTKAEKIARFLDYAAGPGQVRGVAPGQLPAGYVPLTTAMRTQTKKAAAEVRAQKGTLPATPAPAGPKPSNNTTPSPNQPNLPTTTNPGGVTLPLVAGPAPMGGRLSGNVSALVQWLLPVLLAVGLGGALLGPILYGSGAFLDPAGLARRPTATTAPTALSSTHSRALCRTLRRAVRRALCRGGGPGGPTWTTEAQMTTLQDRPETLVEPEPEVSPAVESSPLTYTARALRSGGISIVMLAALILGFVVHLVWISGIQHHRDQATMYAGLRDKLSQGTAPVRPAAAGTPLAILEIPRLGMREVVVEGSSSTDLMHGPGHRRDTPLPGQPGVSVLYGRSLTYGGPFGRLHLLRQADVINVTTGQGVAHYGVSEVNAKAINVPAGSPTLVLVSADSRLAPGREFLVTATLISQVVPGNSTLPVISRPEIGLSGEPSALVPLMLWSQFLLIAAAFATWSYVRWSRWPTYIVTTPILLAGIWNVYENLARLLPNTL